MNRSALMNTQTGKTLAKERHMFMELYQFNYKMMLKIRKCFYFLRSRKNIA